MGKPFGMENAPILNQVRETLRRHGMIAPGDRVLAGVSGGPDSVTLVRILNLLKEDLSFALGVAHLNHGLRGISAERDERFVSELAQELAVPFFSKTAAVEKYCKNHKLSIEHGARRVRYQFFNQVAEEGHYSKIALGHHADDNAEVVLMALLRGSGPLGLSGIPPMRDGVIIRPLYGLTKSQLIEFLKNNNWSYVTDETNCQPVHLRNRIRMHLIPLLEKTYNPRIVRTLNRIAGIFRMENEGLEKITQDLLACAVEEEISKEGKRIHCFSLNFLHTQHPSIKRRFLRGVIHRAKGDLKRITFDHIDGVCRFAEQGQKGGCLHLPDNILICKDRDRITVSRENQPFRTHGAMEQGAPDTGFSYVVHVGDGVTIKELGWRITLDALEREKAGNICSSGQRIAFFDIEKAKFPLILRNFHSHDRFVPLGMTGSQSVMKFLKDHKVPAGQRRRVPVLMSEEKVVWVVGHRIDETFKVTEKTKKIIKAEICRA